MALIHQLNTVECGASGLVGSGLRGCRLDPDNIAGLIALPTGTRITEELTRELFRSMQIDGKLITLNNAYDVTFSPEENQRETSPSLGVMSRSRAGNYNLTAMYKNGIVFQEVLESMSGNNRWDILLVDRSEVIWGAKGKQGELKGFKTSMFDANPYTFKTGTEGGTTSVTIQFPKPAEFASVGYITSEHLDFIPSEMDGANEVVISLSGLVAGTTFSARTTLVDNHTFPDGLTATDFLLKVNGATVPITTATADPTTNSYAFVLDAGDALVVDERVELTLYNTADNEPVISVGVVPDEILYQSRPAIGVVAAA